MKKSIMDIVFDSFDENGILPDNFSLSEDDSDESALSYAPGARDGINYYHVQNYADTSWKEFKDAEAIFEAACTGEKDLEKAIELADKFGKEYGAFCFYDAITQFIYDNPKGYDLNDIYRAAIYFMTRGTEVETVKLGLVFINVFDVEEDDLLKEFIVNIGAYDEFTLFSALQISRWQNADDYLVNLAQRTKGWGKIHAIYNMSDKVKPDIAKWLILYGSVNEFVLSYTAKMLYDKVDFENCLAVDDLHIEFYRGLSRIMYGLLNEGPIAGFSALDNKYKTLDAFVEHTSKRRDLSKEDVAVLREILEYVSNDYDKEYRPICEKLQKFLMSDYIKESV